MVLWRGLAGKLRRMTGSANGYRKGRGSLIPDLGAQSSDDRPWRMGETHGEGVDRGEGGSETNWIRSD